MLRRGSLSALTRAAGAPALVLAFGLVSVAAWADQPPSRGLDEVNHSQVELRGGFWGQRIETPS
ncbi:MAG: hypothetical protein NT049_10445 [Planctomycetota bacterium]|nr:hypothetical protein [Planctomycetota bacterium]